MFISLGVVTCLTEDNIKYYMCGTHSGGYQRCLATQNLCDWNFWANNFSKLYLVGVLIDILLMIYLHFLHKIRCSKLKWNTKEEIAQFREGSRFFLCFV